MSLLVRLLGSLGGGLLFLLLLLTPPVLPSPSVPADGPMPRSTLNIVDFGAVPDGKTDAAKAILAAWDAACGGGGGAGRTVLVPRGTFLVGPVALLGPCSGPMVFRVEGVVIAPADPGVFSCYYWFGFERVDGLNVTGGGTFDGQGESAWRSSGDCPASPDCKLLARSIGFRLVTNGVIQDISSVNSKFFHIEILGSQQITLQSLSITAPADSHNTDGVHVMQSSGVSIVNSVIGTGDDCISVGSGATDLVVSNVTCGPGHGISIGSLGKYPGETDVARVTVRNCTLLNTENGVRIKTWPSFYESSAYNITFEDIVVSNVSKPIVIDQEYCVHSSCSQQSASRVSIRNVTFGNIRGTSALKTSVSLRCSSAVPCRDVALRNIDLEYVDGSESTISNCSNVQASFTGCLSPPPCSTGVGTRSQTVLMSRLPSQGT